MAANLYTTRYSIRQPLAEEKVRQEIRLSWDHIVSTLRNNEHMLSRAIGQGKDILRCLIRKRPFYHIDTSNALVWFSTPANLLPPSKPVIHGLPPEILGRIFAFVVHSDCVDKRHQFMEEVWVNFVRSGTSAHDTCGPRPCMPRVESLCPQYSLSLGYYIRPLAAPQAR